MRAGHSAEEQGMSQQAGESCGTGGGACPSIRGIPLPLLMIVGLLIYSVAQGASARASASNGAPSELLAAMAKVERSYITALWKTGNGTPSEAAASVARLGSAWSAFEGERGAELSRLEGGAAAGTLVSERIEEAASLAAAEPSRAHQVLEDIRLRLRELRVANGIEYFPDRLTAYHEPMEAIVLAAKSGGPAGPGPAAVAEIRTALPEAVENWTALEAAPHDNVVYGLTPEMLDRREALLAEERAALDDLARALDADDTRAIGRAGAALKPGFAKLVLLYGERDG